MDELITTVQDLIAIESVAEPDCQIPGCPHGKGVNQALHYVLQLCSRFGFRTKNCNEQIGWAEIGSGSPMTGILVHLDTVPLGDGWTAGQGEIRDGKLYGRGAIDNKGPAAACIYAMKKLLDSGKPIHGRIRLIFGQLEETGNWTDIDYYRQTEELPDRGFTPDADFPLIFAEKGICVLEFSAPAGSSLLTLDGGTACNVVPASCSCQLQMADGSRQTIQTQGKSAHGSTPEKGINAISRMMEQLYELHCAGDADVPFSRFYQQCIGAHIHGEGFGCGWEDPVSGKLTMNCGTIHLDDGLLKMAVDIRYPVTRDFDALFHQIRTLAADHGVETTCSMHMKPVHAQVNEPFIQTLLQAYRDVTGDHSEPIAIGGGTYARSLDHIVAFGALLPGRPLTEHQADEHIRIDDLLSAEQIYFHALSALHGAQA